MTPREGTSPGPQRSGHVFELHECVGRGGFGDVYRAILVSPSGVRQTVAIKVLRAGLDPYGQAVERLRDEARLLSRIDHPAILKVRDLVLIGERVSLVTEYVDGVDLSSLIKPENDLSPRMLAECIADVASGLDAAWSTVGDDGAAMRLVHRDIKPANLRISRHGQVKLLDFGIARADIEREADTVTDSVIGTYQYMSPERFSNVDGPEGDVYGLGCVLFEGLAGRRYLAGRTLHQHYAVVANAEAYEATLGDELAALPEGLPEPLLALLRAVLAYDPAARPPAADLAAELELLAPTLPGPTRGAWCRSRSFPEPGRPGDLTGIRVSDAHTPPSIGPRQLRAEGMDGRLTPTLVPRVPLATPPTSRRRARARATPPWWVWALVLLSLTCLGAVLTSLSAGLAVGRQLVGEAAVQPAARAPTRRASLPDTVPVETEVVWAPEAIVRPAPQLGAMEVDTPIPTRLVGADGRAMVPLGDLPAGLYTIEADFGAGYVTAGSATVRAHRRNIVRCSPDLQSCTIE